MIKVHRGHDAHNRIDDVPSLVACILSAVADGSCRPGSWERQMREMMALVADCDDYRPCRDR